MSDYGSSGAPGWYYAQGDPPGTFRYWDGELWIGDPVAAPQTLAPPGSLPGQVPQSFASVHQPQMAYMPVPVRERFDIAGYGHRVLGALIDLVLFVPGYAFLAIVQDNPNMPEGLESIAAITMALTFVFQVCNIWIMQGITGQSVGKRLVGTRIVKDVDGSPVGVGLMLGRLVLRALFSLFTCNLYTLVDWLSPLWDQDNQRITDKMTKLHVVNAKSTPMTDSAADF